ncbi:MAG TPA: hypothetical protein VJX70_00290 [Candidatus Acidoferrum sp.]|nr:hypothetical protein [Candidatus Acidoferrum sp.]
MALPGAATPHSAATAAAPVPSSANPQKETTRNPHGPLTIPCENCHTSAGWRPIRAVPEFDHNKTSYPLRGMHEKVQCTQCHVKPVFTNVGKNCADCHADIHRRQMGPNCAQCHTVQGWDIAVQAVRDHQNRFPLLGAHAAVQCDECHKQAATGMFLGLPTACDSCHLKDWQNTTNPPHASAGAAFASSNCQGCHFFDSWLGAKFDHSTTGFLLTAGHANVPCASCHINNNYNLQIAPTDCGNSGCHLSTWQQTNNPVHSTAGSTFAASNCANCHTTAGWDEASFNHSLTGFALVGTHMSPTPTPCVSCHINNNYTLSSTDCMSCHTADWNSTQTIGGSVPNHISAGFPSTASACSTCHTITKWSDGKFDHSATGFLLTNGHANVQCALCHINGNYSLNIQPTDCGNSGCHLTTWQQTNNPVHSTSGAAFGAANCSKCHTTVGWDAASFDHSVTGFALVGTHVSPTPTPCLACHVNNNYTLNTSDCMSCHSSSWNSTQTIGGNVPNHVASNFPSTAAACSSCHTITVWANGVFDHSTTGFPLTNSHQLAPAGKVTTCTQCHIGGNYTLNIQPTDCGNSGCHLTTWQQTNNPTHSSAGAPFAAANCSTCHTTISWTTATFDHSTTGWPLTGAHATTPCASCHVNNHYNFTVANTDCYGCHQDKYNGTATMGGAVPNHVAAGFPTSQCSTCHTTTSWTSTWSHNSTGFPLQNLHQFAPAGKIVACTDCHTGNNYNLQVAPTACGTAGCHLTTWQQTNAPVHSAAGAAFALANCATCHTTTGWGTANFDHSTTGWALTGTHLTTPCTSCHVNNNYSLTSANTDCYGCHQSTWLSTQTLGGIVPNHVAAGFPTSLCSTCHNTVAWNPGTFDHSTTGWALTGAHQMPPAAGSKITACTDCHVSNNYTLTSANTACYGCHQAAWLSTQTLGGSVPNHIAAGYPQTCDTCHTTTSWLGATFNHTYFPIPHHGSVCSDCHQVSTNYASFTCINCHTQTAHQQSQTNNIHDGVGGYSYGPTTCYTCHKNGGGG